MSRRPVQVRLTTNTARPLLRQPWDVRGMTVGTTRVAMSNQDSQSAVNLMVDAFQVVVPSTAANSVWMGKQNVVVGVGMECRAGVPFEWSIKQERQLYELQKPYDLVNCLDELQVPFIVWDVSQFFFIASAPTNISVIEFYAPFI